MFKFDYLPDSPKTAELDSLARITIGEFSEVVGLCHLNGDLTDTKRMVSDELRKLVDGRDFVAIRTQPMFAWVFYRVDSHVFIQEQLLADDWEGNFDDNGSIESVPKRRKHSAEGARISEWSTTIGSIKEFLAQ